MAEALTGDRIPVEVNPVLVRQNDVKPLCDDPAKLRSFGDWETQPLAETPGWILRDAKD
ncbi:MAG: hypothetical protein RBR20_13045 [Desulfobacterales bacterium]|nr:hypothetical protein [Desulfobacterales bacterium]